MLSFSEYLVEIKKPEQVENEKNALKEYLSDKHPYHKLDSEERSSIKEYTKNSRDLNNHLYKSHSPDATSYDFKDSKKIPYKNSKEFNTESMLHEHMIKHLDSAADKSKTKKAFHTYSGIKFDPDKEASKHPDRHIHLPAYTSTTLDPNIAKRFAYTRGGDESNNVHHVLKIKVKKGTKAIPVLDHTSYPTPEDEVLLARNTTLKIANKPHKKEKYRKFGFSTELNIHHWHAEIMHQGE